MATYYTGKNLGDILATLDLLPKNTRNVEMLVPVDGVLCLRYEVFLTSEDCRKLGQALLMLSEESEMTSHGTR